MDDVSPSLQETMAAAAALGVEAAAALGVEATAGEGGSGGRRAAAQPAMADMDEGNKLRSSDSPHIPSPNGKP